MAKIGTPQLFKEDKWYEIETRLSKISLDHGNWHGVRERFGIGPSFIKY